MEALGINLGYLIMQILIITIMMLILRGLVYKPIIRVLDELSSVKSEDPASEEFVEMIKEIKLFSNKADSTLETLVKSDANWFVGTFMSMIK